MVIDEVHNRSAHSDYVLALTLAAMQKKSTLRLVLTSATGDHSLVPQRIPHCQRLVMKGVMHKVRRCFLEQPLNRTDNLDQTAGPDPDPEMFSKPKTCPVLMACWTLQVENPALGER